MTELKDEHLETMRSGEVGEVEEVEEYESND